MAWSFVCPASRGIGFELTRQLLLTTKIPVVATARKDITSVKQNLLSDLKDVDSSRLTVLEVDVTGIFFFLIPPNHEFLNNPHKINLSSTNNAQQTNPQSQTQQKKPPPSSRRIKTTYTSPSAFPGSSTPKKHLRKYPKNN